MRMSVFASERGISPDLYLDIENAAQVAYQVVSETDHYQLDEVHYRGVCCKVPYLMVQELISAGRRASVDAATVCTSAIGVLTHSPLDSRYSRDHHYVSIDHESTEVIADGTWQQYLGSKQRTRNLPRVLIGSRLIVAAKAYDAGIRDKAALALWLPAAERDGLTSLYC